MIRRLLLLPPALAVAAFQRLSQIHSRYRYVSRRACLSVCLVFINHPCPKMGAAASGSHECGSGFFFLFFFGQSVRGSEFQLPPPPFLPAKPRPPGASGQETEDLEDSPLAWLADFEADAAALAADSGGEEWA